MTDKKKALAKAIIADFRNKKQRDPKDELELTLFVEELGGEKYLLKMQDKLTKAALHGAKLNYIKSLKNQCAEDEEITYFKKGGSVRCGCRKKEDGGEIAKAQKGSAVDKFKNRKKEIKQEPPKQDLAARDSIRINSVKGDTELEATRPGNYKPNPKYNPKDPNSRTHTWVPDRTKEPYNKDKKDKVKKDCGGSAIKKFKMHRLGGSLNRILFYQKGTNKGGIEKSDNTRVNKIPNKGEGIYEQVPVDGWDFVPLVSTYREALRLDLGDPNASKLGFATSLGFDALGAGTIGPALKASTKAFRLNKLLKSRGFNKITKQNPFGGPAKEAYMKIDYSTATPTIRFKQVPNVDATGVAVTPFLQTLRVPAQAAAH